MISFKRELGMSEAVMIRSTIKQVYMSLSGGAAAEVEKEMKRDYEDIK